MIPRVNDPRRYSGRGEALDVEGPLGTPVAGTAGAQDDINRYRGMAWAPPHPNAVQIDQARSNETRSIQGGALGMLRARAEGGETPAQAMARAQTAGAVAGIHSGAASIKGGAAARAAAARGATATAARVGAQGAQDVQALRAREMANAAGQYMGGASAQRGQDLGLAASQAQLEAQHRAAQDQREQAYEQAAFDVGNADNLGRLGADAQDTRAASAAYHQAAQNGAADRAWTGQLVSTGVGGITGGVTAYGMGQGPDLPAPGQGPRNVNDVVNGYGDLSLPQYVPSGDPNDMWRKKP